jgi:hypothetical protein
MCRHGCPGDDFCIVMGWGRRRIRLGAVMFTTEELATVPLFSELEEKALEYLPAKLRTSISPPGSTSPTRAKVGPWRSWSRVRPS